jgi:hypothetical protein
MDGITMTRIEPLERDAAPADAQRFFDLDEQLYGTVLNPTRVQAYRPSILAASKGLSRSVGVDAVLPAGLRALVCMRVAMLVGCPLPNHRHAKLSARGWTEH